MLKEYLYNEIKNYLKSIAKDTYVISILINFNECNVYDNIENFTYVSIFSNTLSDIEDSNDEEEKWNMAFWGCNDEKYLIADDKSAKLLVDWYAENGVDNIGYEDDEQDYDDEMNYIGNGPNGCKELYALISEVVLNLRSDNEVAGIIADVPILIHDYEYSYYITKYIKSANPDGQAGEFLKYYEGNF